MGGSKRLPGILAALAFVASACSGAQATATPTAGPTATAAPPATASASPRAPVTFTVGVLAPIAGGSGTTGVAWDASARLAVKALQDAINQAGLSSQYTVNVVTEDDTGNATAGVQAATKLVSVDKANVIIGPVFSSIAVPVAQSVAIPNNIPMFTAGSSPAISTLQDNDLVFRTIPSDSLQGQVLAKAMATAFGANSTINVGARNDAYGAGLADAFATAWTAGGGVIGQKVLWNTTQATYDTEAAKVVSGSPAGWLMVAFPDDWAKVQPALARTGKWDPLKSFGGDSFYCAPIAAQGMRAVEPSVSSGPSFQLYKSLRDAANLTVPFQGSTDPEAFDDTVIAFLAAVAADSNAGPNLVKQVRSIVTPSSSAQSYTIDHLADAIKALNAGQAATYSGAVGVQGFDANGDPLNSIFDTATATDSKGGCQVTSTVNMSSK